MARPHSGPFGTLKNLNRLARSALTLDALLATGRSWHEIEAEVRREQYEARGLRAPRLDVVRRYFALDLAPALDPGYRTSLGYPAALALQYPEVRQMVVAPLLDLLFGLDLPKRDQAKRKERFPDRVIEEAVAAGRSGDADLMRMLNEISPGRRRGRASEQPFRPLWSLYQTLLLCGADLVQVLFEESNGCHWRRIRPIQDEVADLGGHADLDALALLYGLMLEALELADLGRVRAARTAVLSWLPTLQDLPACRRVHPIIERAVRRACDQAMPRQFSRPAAFDRVRPPSWREPGPFAAISELVFGFPSNSEEIDFFTLREMNVRRLSDLIEERARNSLARRAKPRKRGEGHGAARQGAAFPFKARTARPLLAFHRAIAGNLREVEGWAEGRFWIIQKGTRCAVAASGQASFPLMFLDFDHVRGDPVVDRPIQAVPWILAKVLWIGADADVRSAIRAATAFLRRG